MFGLNLHGLDSLRVVVSGDIAGPCRPFGGGPIPQAPSRRFLPHCYRLRPPPRGVGESRSPGARGEYQRAAAAVLGHPLLRPAAIPTRKYPPPRLAAPPAPSRWLRRQRGIAALIQSRTTDGDGEFSLAPPMEKQTLGRLSPLHWPRCLG